MCAPKRFVRGLAKKRKIRDCVVDGVLKKLEVRKQDREFTCVHNCFSTMFCHIRSCPGILCLRH